MAEMQGVKSMYFKDIPGATIKLRDSVFVLRGAGNACAAY